MSAVRGWSLPGGALAFALGFALLAAESEPAAANGNGYGGIKDYSAGVPVPAPIPVPVYDAQWYLRLDIGVGFASDPDVSTSGEPFGTTIAGAIPIGLQPAWLSKDFDTFLTVGGGVGYYWSRRFRTDLTVDYHSEGEAKFNGTAVLVDAVDAPVGNVQVRDVTKHSATVFLFNGYYDFAKMAGFTPYIGGGVGFAINRLKRDHDSEETDGALCAPFPDCATVSASDKEQNVTFAAALMAGVSFDLSSVTTLDLNYRFLHIAGSDIGLNINGVSSKVDIDDINEHQIRAGLRFNVN